MEHHSFPDTSIPAAYGPYSHTVIAGDFVFLSGQTARDPKTGILIEGDVAAQTHRCLEIVREILTPTLHKFWGFCFFFYHAAFCNTSRKCSRSFRTASLALSVRVSWP